MTAPAPRTGTAGDLCECLVCGRNHPRLGSPPWGLSHEDAARLSRLFNEHANLAFPHDHRINEWLKRLVALTLAGAAP